MKISFRSQGCRLNRAESDALQQLAEARGHEIVQEASEADVLVLNTCTITHRADVDGRKLLRSSLRKNPRVRVVVTGCAAQARPQTWTELGAAAVLGNHDKPKLLELIDGLPRPGEPPLVRVSALTRNLRFAEIPSALAPQRSRAQLKVQDGCNYRCSFCIVPFVRGPSRSLAADGVLQELDRLLATGVPEVVVTGIHLGTYGRDLVPRTSLAELLARMLQRVRARSPGTRLRLSSLDPHEVHDDLIQVLKEHPENMCRHLHLSVQSGDPEVLDHMRRAHGVEEFTTLVRGLAARIPGIAIGTDLIVGFPGESEAAFARTEALLDELPISYCHVFAYSPRSGTFAAKLVDDVSPQEKQRRSGILRAKSRRNAARFRKSFTGQVLDAVVHRRPDKSGELRAVTDNFIHLRFAGPRELCGNKIRLRLEATGVHLL